MRLRRPPAAMAGSTLCIPISTTWRDQPHLSMRHPHRWELILLQLPAEISFNIHLALPLETTPALDSTAVSRVWRPVESSKSRRFMHHHILDPQCIFFLFVFFWLTAHFCFDSFRSNRTLTLLLLANLLLFLTSNESIQLRCCQRWVSSRWHVFDRADSCHVSSF